MFIECTFLFRLCVSLIFRQFNCLLILRCLCNCAQCDYGLFGGGLIVIVNQVFTLFYLPHYDSSVMLCFMILRFCSTVVFIVMMHHVNTLHFQMVYQLRNKMMVVNLNKYTGY